MPTPTITKRKLIIDTLTVDSNGGNSGWRTIIFNCYCHMFEEVVDQIIRATRCTREKSRGIP